MWELQEKEGGHGLGGKCIPHNLHSAQTIQTPWFFSRPVVLMSWWLHSSSGSAQCLDLYTDAHTSVLSPFLGPH